VMRPLALGSDANIVYTFNQGNNVGSGSFGELKRYDVRTGSKTVIAHIANVLIKGAQVSNDGQWILFLTNTTSYDEMQMIRMDGQGLQTLYCNTAVFDLQWSPDHSMVVFSVASAKLGVSTLNMNTGQVLPELYY
jgi:Tol biopolymer transport system component